MKELSGIPASPGLVTGPALLYIDEGLPEIARYTIPGSRLEAEWTRLLEAFEAAGAEIRTLKERAGGNLSAEQAGILDAHLIMLEDPEFRGEIRARLEKTLENIERVVYEVTHDLIQKMMTLQDASFRERAVDIADVSRRLLSILLSIKRISLAELEEDVILVARDLLPSDLLSMNRDRVKGIVMDMGSRTSHTAILARAFEIPAVLGLSTASREILTGDILMLNGSLGSVGINPSDINLERYRQDAGYYRTKIEGLLPARDLPAETLDGFRVTLKANIEMPEEADQALHYGAGGIGLYRSEFLFLSPGAAAKEEGQYLAYSRVLKTMGERPVTIRTLDLGGDKILPEFHLAEEKNPLLGWRALRFCLSTPELFRTQLRAILRASMEGNVRIMFPMISGIGELEAALACLEEAKAECREKQQPFRERIEVGAMIEIPSAALTADILARRSAFFSIGTNDLLQYTLAVDRGNEKVNYLANPFHPAMLRLLRQVIDGAHAAGIKAAMCGELAGDTQAAALLLGLGLDEFSMNARSIPFVKQVIRALRMEDCRELALEALQCSRPEEAATLTGAWMARHFTED
ncbi:MAG: phosphoenolpyruvate--protein phosphotransferase [Treponema sp.]|jgi:phosphotransferase system enzyme I (PtsI)|nr:phosphoenolpyruvate--protein phosphotransferase [Treponema sp.]